MPIYVVNCPGCGCRGRIKAEQIGKNLKCRGCGEGFFAEGETPEPWIESDGHDALEWQTSNLPLANSAQWYYKVCDSVIGPVTLGTIRCEINSGIIFPESLIKMHGAADWVAAGSLLELFQRDPKARKPRKPLARQKRVCHESESKSGSSVRNQPFFYAAVLRHAKHLLVIAGITCIASLAIATFVALSSYIFDILLVAGVVVFVIFVIFAIGAVAYGISLRPEKERGGLFVVALVCLAIVGSIIGEKPANYHRPGPEPPPNLSNEERELIKRRFRREGMTESEAAEATRVAEAFMQAEWQRKRQVLNGNK